MSKTITNQRTIARTLKAAQIGDRFEVKFTTFDSVVWFHDEGGVRMILDAAKDSLYSSTIADIVEGRACVYELTGTSGDDVFHIKHVTTTDTIRVWSQHIATLRPMPGPVTHDIEGLDYALTLDPAGHAKVGCQTIPRKSLQQIHDLLGKHLAATLASAAD